MSPSRVDSETEVWRPVPSAPGYEASNLGRVRSLSRRTPRVATVGPCGFLTISLYGGPGRRCARMGTLVAEAWIGPRPAGLEVRRLDGDTFNDRADNLAYGTKADVAADHAARARREEAEGAPTHCPNGHRYADTWLGNWGRRMCLVMGSRADAGGCRPVKPRTTTCGDCGTSVTQSTVKGAKIAWRCRPCQDAENEESKRRYYASAKGRETRMRAEALRIDDIRLQQRRYARSERGRELNREAVRRYRASKRAQVAAVSVSSASQ